MIGTIKSFVAVHALRILGGLLAAAAIFAAVQTIRIEGVWCAEVEAGDKPACLVRGFKQELQIVRIDLAAARAQAIAEAAKHKATKQAYADAQAEAARLEAQRIERVIQQQKAITDEVETDYRRQLDAVRARADRLRRQAEAAARGSRAAGPAGDLQLPPPGDAAGRTDAAPDCQRFPAPDPLTDLECRRIATEQAAQLEALIEWVSRQFRVEP